MLCISECSKGYWALTWYKHMLFTEAWNLKGQMYNNDNSSYTAAADTTVITTSNNKDHVLSSHNIPGPLHELSHSLLPAAPRKREVIVQHGKCREWVWVEETSWAKQTYGRTQTHKVGPGHQGSASPDPLIQAGMSLTGKPAPLCVFTPSGLVQVRRLRVWHTPGRGSDPSEEISRCQNSQRAISPQACFQTTTKPAF